MAQELELSENTTVHKLWGSSGKTEQSERRLLRMGMLTLGVLCVIQATLNISLRAAFYSKEDVDQLSFNGSVIADLCQVDQSQQNPNQSCCCCSDLLRKLLKEYQNLKTERDILRDEVNELSQSTEGTNLPDNGSGSDFLEEY